MTESQALTKHLERAIALAHAALEEPTEARLASARELVSEVAPRLRRLERQPLTLAEARHIMELLIRLRAVYSAVDSRGEPAPAV